MRGPHRNDGILPVELVEQAREAHREQPRIVRADRDLALRARRSNEHKPAAQLNLLRFFREISTIHCSIPTPESTRRASGTETASLRKPKWLTGISARLPLGAPGASGKSSRIANARQLGPTRSGIFTLAGC
jgi:hypothetical protein